MKKLLLDMFILSVIFVALSVVLGAFTSHLIGR